ncbi:MAG: hypothetical protein AB8B55_13870 [Mariniblastus sp.]
METQMRAIFIILAILITGVGGWFLGSQYGTSLNVPSNVDSDSQNTPGLPANNPQTIHGLGKLVPADGLIKIVAPPGERIANLIDRKVGEKVRLGETLLTLQSRQLREKDLALAIARRSDALKKVEYEKEQGAFTLDSAKLALAEAEASDEKIAGEAQKIKLLERQLAAAKKLQDRLLSIQANPVSEDLVNQTEMDKQQLLVEQIRLQIEQANLDIMLGKKSAERAKTVAQNNFSAVANTLKNAEKAIPIQSLDAAVAMAKKAYEMTQIESPVDSSTILDIIVREGDSATNQPVMILGNTDNMHCVVEVNDSFLHLIDLDKHNDLRAKITSTALKQPMLGTIIAKGIMIGAPSLKDPNPFASVDRRTGTVTVKLDDSKAAAKLVNLQVEVELEVEPGALK